MGINRIYNLLWQYCDETYHDNDNTKYNSKLLLHCIFIHTHYTLTNTWLIEDRLPFLQQLHGLSAIKHDSVYGNTAISISSQYDVGYRHHCVIIAQCNNNTYFYIIIKSDISED